MDWSQTDRASGSSTSGLRLDSPISQRLWWSLVSLYCNYFLAYIEHFPGYITKPRLSEPSDGDNGLIVTERLMRDEGMVVLHLPSKPLNPTSLEPVPRCDPYTFQFCHCRPITDAVYLIVLYNGSGLYKQFRVDYVIWNWTWQNIYSWYVLSWLWEGVYLESKQWGYFLQLCMEIKDICFVNKD